MLISIIIPTCLRSESELIRAIDSILWNGYDDIEIVVVNDNRVNDFDEFPTFLSKYSLAPMRFIKNTGDTGAASARNYGVKHASGELVTFLDDDDFILPGRIEQMFTAFMDFEPRGVNLISTGRVYQYENLAKIQVVQRQIFGIVTLKDIYIHNDIDIGFMVRKSLFLELNGFDSSYHNLEDWDFVIRALKKGNAYKIRSFSYMVKNDTSDTRVSNNDHLGLKMLAKNFQDEFGLAWYYKIKVQQKLSEGRLSLLQVSLSIFETKSIYPFRLWLGSFLRRFVKIFKNK